MATVAQPCPSWTRGSIPFPKRISRRRFTGRTSLTRVNPQLQARAAVVEATPPPPSSARDRSSQVLTLPANRAGELQAEGRAMTRAVNATVYNPQLLASEYGSQPLKVVRRTLQILTALGSFGLKLLLDQRSGMIDQNKRARASELKTTFTQLGPTFVKLGQGLSTRPDICPPEYLEELSELQDGLPTFPDEEAFACIERELGLSLESIFSSITPSPMAAASLGQVYKAQLKYSGKLVAVKVQRPSIEEAIGLDFYLIRGLGFFINKYVDIITTDVVALIDEFARRVFQELNYVQEGQNARKFKKLYADKEDVCVPDVFWDYTSGKVLTMEWVDGVKLNEQEAIERQGLKVLDLVNTGIQCSLRQLLEYGYFHADPHPGNLLATPEGKLAFLDFGMMSETPEEARVAIIGHVVHLVNRDYEAMARDYYALDFLSPDVDVSPIVRKNELVAAGRVDLVEAIVEEGGWLAYGWDLNDGFLESHDLEDGSGSEIEYNATWASGVASTSSTSSSANSSQPAKSVEFEAEESGIEGILNRLEKYRSNSFGSGFRGKEDSTSSENNEDRDEWDHRTPTNAVKLDQHKSQLGTDSFRNSLKPEMWKSWVIQRNGSQDADFEDAEIVPSEAPKGVSNVSGRPDILKTNKFSSELRSRETGWDSVDGIRNANHIDIKSRLQHLESELSSALHVMRSITPKASMDLEQKSSSDDLAKLSDALEFRENEIMHAQDTLRSLRAKLSVLEGKMAMKKMDAQKAAEEKQKKIKNANKAVNLLKSVDIVWPKPASEVFLVGSFDGWSFKRKMERSVTGVFTLALYLYPGTYEIKFIVDGEWQIDPLLPIVNNNGHENNVLTVRDWRRA